MTTDDTAALTEQIAEAIYEAAWQDGTRLRDQLDYHQELYRRKAAAVLPIIRKAERDAAREALDGLYEDASQDYRIGVQGSDQGRMDAAEAVLRAVYAWMDHYPEETP